MKTKVLIVDDASTIRMYLRSLLESPHRDVFEARDGVEALELLASVTPDFAIVDINMPGMDGFELLRRMRQRPETRGTPVLMCSTESRPIDEHSAYVAGACYYIRKPAPPDLVTGLATILETGL